MAKEAITTENLELDHLQSILEELLEIPPAQIYFFAMSLMLPIHVIENIFYEEKGAVHRLFQVLKRFLEQSKTSPTWRTIIEALNSETVRQNALARKLESKFYPITKAKEDIPCGRKESPDIENFDPELEAARHQCEKLQKHYIGLINTTKKLLKKLNITMTYLVIALTLNDGHRSLPKEFQDLLQRANTPEYFFSKLSVNYLAYHRVVAKLSHRKKYQYSFRFLKARMNDYKKEVKMFRRSTTLAIFCRTIPNMDSRQTYIPSQMIKKVADHEWPATITLENVEEFRATHAKSYTLKECTMMVKQLKQ